MFTYDVYNEKAKLLSGRGIADNRTECLFCTNREWQTIKMHNDLSRDDSFFSGQVGRRIKFVDHNSELKKLAESVNNVTFTGQLEQGGGIYFNCFNNTVSYRKAEGSVSARRFSFIRCMIQAADAGELLLGIVHSHPEEQLSLAQGFSDQAIFDAQYNEELSTDGDGLYVTLRKFMLYSVGFKEIDFYSPKGKSRSKNGLCSNDSVLAGTYNLMKHALQMYGRYY